MLPVEIALIVGLSVASYFLVEQPFQRRRVPVLSRGRLSLVLWPLALAIVFGSVVVGSGYAAHQRDVRETSAKKWYQDHHVPTGSSSAQGAAGIAEEVRRAVSLARSGAPFPPGLDLHQVDKPQPGKGYQCFAKAGQERLRRSCVYGDPAASRSLALIGDSHAGTLIPALDALGKQRHVRVVMFQKLDCGPYDVTQNVGSVARECTHFRAWTDAQLRATPPDAVLLYGRGFLDVHPRAGRTIASLWGSGVTSTVRQMKGLGATVVLVGDVPAHPHLPLECIQGNTLESACLVAPTSPESRSNVVTRSVAASEHVIYLPLEQFVCAGQSCPLVVGSRILYWDFAHLSRSWIDHITPALGEKLAPVMAARTGS